MILQVDLDHGGRWTSLRSRDREWLWRNETVDPATRAAAAAGAAFVDAGGGEECWPTVRGRPDHGDVWTRPWSGDPGDASVTVPGLGTLRRRISGAEPDCRALSAEPGPRALSAEPGTRALSLSKGPALQVDYTITGDPGVPFLHAVHLLLDLSPAAVITVPEAETMVVLDQPDPVRTWPGGLDRLGPDDGTAVCALLPGVRSAMITDGPDRLLVDWDCPERPELCSLLLWRNLRGWPEHAPYRSIGVEPMLGRSADLDSAEPRDCAAGTLAWRLTLRDPVAADDRA